MAKMPSGPFTKGRTGTPAFRPVGSANKLPIGNYTKGKPGTPAYRPVGKPTVSTPLPPVGVNTPPPAPKRRPASIMASKQQVISNIAKSYGTPEPRVKEGTIFPRNPMPGRGGGLRRFPSR